MPARQTIISFDQIFSVAFVETYLILNNIRAVYHI